MYRLKYRSVGLLLKQVVVLVTVGLSASHALAQTNDQSAYSFVDASTMMVIRIDVSGIQLSSPAENDLESAETRAGIAALQERVDALAMLVGESPLFVKVNMPIIPSQLPLSIFVSSKEEIDTAALNELFGLTANPEKVNGYWRFATS